ncbi:MAG: hypothetical protein ACOVNS_07960, partial [Erythrobacter sp.]
MDAALGPVVGSEAGALSGIATAGLDETINRAVEPIANAVGGAIFSRACLGDGLSFSMSGACGAGETAIPLIVAWLLMGGVVCTL